MKNGLIISDTGPIFSLAIVNQLNLLLELFDEIFIPKAVWEELTLDKNTSHYQAIYNFFHNRIKDISSFNDLTFVMDYGESEAVILYKETQANFLLIDDRKARKIAENFDIQCIGTLGILSAAKDKKLLPSLRPMFLIFLENQRYYGLKLLNSILIEHGENLI